MAAQGASPNSSFRKSSSGLPSAEQVAMKCVSQLMTDAVEHNQIELETTCKNAFTTAISGTQKQGISPHASFYTKLLVTHDAFVVNKNQKQEKSVLGK